MFGKQDIKGEIKMKSLNEVYTENKLFYYCNACGDINMPNTDPLSYHDVDELEVSVEVKSTKIFEY